MHQCKFRQVVCKCESINSLASHFPDSTCKTTMMLLIVLESYVQNTVGPFLPDTNGYIHSENCLLSDVNVCCTFLNNARLISHAVLSCMQ